MLLKVSGELYYISKQNLEIAEYAHKLHQEKLSSADLEEIVQTALTESQIESLIIAKGYADCVAYMSDEGISVAVSAPEGGLKQTDVALIADIVMTQSDYSLDDIRVVEVQ